MGKSRLEAFSDGVIAIIITIMVLDLKVAWANLHLIASQGSGSLLKRAIGGDWKPDRRTESALRAEGSS